MGFHYVGRIIFNLIALILRARRQVIGLENLPEKGPYLLVTNHMSVWDSPLIMICFPPMMVWFLIAELWEKTPVINRAAPRLGGIFIDRSRMDRRALREALGKLEQGEVVGLAPEGSRSMIDQLIRPKHGAAFLATHADVPLVPVAITGTEHITPNFFKLKTTKVTLEVGKPFRLPELKAKKSLKLQAYSDLIMMKIAEMLPEKYYGYYEWVEHPALEALKNGEDVWGECVRYAGIEESSQ